MVIHAIYENGIFRPVAPVELPNNCEVDLMIQRSTLSEAEPRTASPLAGIAVIASQHPQNPKLPQDLAEQHDHYLYGASKRS